VDLSGFELKMCKNWVICNYDEI